jgi:hypothetical protein
MVLDVMSFETFESYLARYNVNNCPDGGCPQYHEPVCARNSAGKLTSFANECEMQLKNCENYRPNRWQIFIIGANGQAQRYGGTPPGPNYRVEKMGYC